MHASILMSRRPSTADWRARMASTLVFSRHHGNHPTLIGLTTIWARPPCRDLFGDGRLRKLPPMTPPGGANNLQTPAKPKKTKTNQKKESRNQKKTQKTKRNQKGPPEPSKNQQKVWKSMDSFENTWNPQKTIASMRTHAIHGDPWDPCTSMDPLDS